VTHARIDWIRWVNNNDIVPRVPPRWMGYAHAGQEMYLNAHGKLRRMTKWQRVKDRWRGFLMSLRQGKIDHLADHSIDRYISYIRDAVKEHEGT
ncbi:MAG: hypothetical protein KDA60_20270, partial [Planctomycetales bacterium]|nr:hypothetical protein [Planctomycetales bacterium]